MTTLVSIIVPLANEEENVAQLVAGIKKVLDSSRIPFELLLVDDGSRDRTFMAIQKEHEQDSRIKGFRFRRNFGQTTAIKAGVDNAQGEICITMDGDLQHDPVHIPEFIDKINAGYDLVCGYRLTRNNDGFLRWFPSKAANFLARRFSKLKLRDFGSTFRAYRTSLAQEMPIQGEMHRFIPVFFNMQTSRIAEIPIVLRPRQYGRSKYGLDRIFRVASDLFLVLFFARFFNRPIHVFGYISIFIGLPGFAILSWLSLSKIFGNLAILDYGPFFILGVLLCLVSIQTFIAGIVCEYLIRIYYAKNERKPYSIAETTAAIEK